LHERAMSWLRSRPLAEAAPTAEPAAPAAMAWCWYCAGGVVAGAILLPILIRYACKGARAHAVRARQCAALRGLRPDGASGGGAGVCRLARGAVRYKGKHVVISGGSSGYPPDAERCRCALGRARASPCALAPNAQWLMRVRPPRQHRARPR